MTQDDAIKAIFGAILTTLVGAFWWVTNKVLKNREDNVQQASKLGELEGRLISMEKKQLTKEDIREVIQGALSARDLSNQERRKEWDETLTLRIEKAVHEGVTQCHQNTKEEIELMVPRLMKELMEQTGFHKVRTKE